MCLVYEKTKGIRRVWNTDKHEPSGLYTALNYSSTNETYPPDLYEGPSSTVSTKYGSQTHWDELLV